MVEIARLSSYLAIVQGLLTTIGGTLGDEYTNSLLSLVGEVRDRKWSEHYPRMPTGRHYPAAICSGQALIVTGGACGYDILATVEVLNIDTMQWSIASSLPCPFTFATAAVCGDRLYLLGGNTQFYGMTCIAYVSSIPELLKSSQLLAVKQTIWQQIADTPYYHSTCANLCGWLVAVGGRTETREYTTAVSVYDETTDSWENALVAVLSGNMVVVGRLCWKPRLTS